MKVDAVDLHAAAVQVEAVVGQELRRTDTETHVLHVRLARRHRRGHGETRIIKVRLFDVPQPRLAHLDVEREQSRTLRRDGPLFATLRGRLQHMKRRAVAGPVKTESGTHLGRHRQPVRHGELDVHRRAFARDARRVDERGSRQDVNRRRGHETHVAVDARTRIPAGMVAARIRPHRQRVDAGMHERRRIHAEAHVAILPATGMLAVDVDLRIRHHAVELEPECAALLDTVEIHRRHVERPTVPAHAAPRQLARAVVAVRIERSLDGPVVRHGNVLPRTVVELRRRRVQRTLLGRVARELPAVAAERDRRARILIVTTRHERGERQDKQHLLHS